MRGTTIARGAAAVALGLGTLAMASGAGASGQPTTTWSGHGSEHIGTCEGDWYHFVLNRYQGNPGAMTLLGQAPYKHNRGTVHWNVQVTDFDQTITVQEATAGGLVISGCGTPGEEEPPPTS